MVIKAPDTLSGKIAGVVLVPFVNVVVFALLPRFPVVIVPILVSETCDLFHCINKGSGKVLTITFCTGKVGFEACDN